jgi:hypothetical protein
MRMEDRGNERILSLCGTILNRQPLVFCEQCGGVLGTQRYLDYIRGRLHKTGPGLVKQQLCDACGRKAGLQHSRSAFPIT